MDSPPGLNVSLDDLGKYMPVVGLRQSFNGGKQLTATDENIRELARLLHVARSAQFAERVSHLSSLLGQIYLDNFNFAEARQRCEEAVDYASIGLDKDRLAYSVANLAVIEYYLGNGAEALMRAHQAVQIACDYRLDSLAGYTMSLLGASLCFCGRYQEGKESFEQARTMFNESTDKVGIAWWQMLYAREYYREQEQVKKAIELIEGALPILQEQSVAAFTIEALLTLADCYLRLGKTSHA